MFQTKFILKKRLQFFNFFILTAIDKIKNLYIYLTFMA